MEITVKIPNICDECKFTNFKFYGHVRYGKSFLEVKCEKCGKTAFSSSSP